MSNETICLSADDWRVILQESEGDIDFLDFMMGRFFSGEVDIDEWFEEHGQARAA